MRKAPLPVALVGLAVLATISCSSEATDNTAPGTATPSATATTAAPVVEFTAAEVISGLTVPRSVHRLPDGQMLVVDQAGAVLVTDARWQRRPEPLVDTTDLIMEPSRDSPELGLSGFALAPDFASTGVFYTLTTEQPRGSESGRRMDRLRRWRADPATLVVRGESTVLLSIPYAGYDHAGGGLVFDSRGNLFIGVGASTRDASALDPNTLTGKILRIRPTATGYDTPADNPFANGGGRQEIFSYGYRNPFRLAWDDTIGLIVSEPMFTEKNQQVSVATAGANAGYPSVARDRRCWVDATLADHCRTDANGRPITPPVLEYGTTIGQIVAGAVAIRGTELGLDGAVVVADWSGVLLAATPAGAAPWTWRKLGVAPGAVTGRLWAIEADPAGGVLLMMTNAVMAEGRILRLTRI